MKQNKKELGYIFLAALLPVFCLFIFGPMDLFAGNKNELGFRFSQLCLAVLPVGIVVWAVLAGVGLLLRKTKAIDVYCAILCAAGLALYVQGNYLNASYGILDGSEINWNEFSATAVINTVIWVGLFAAAIVLAVIFKKRMRKFLAGISGAVILIQVITLAVLTFTGGFASDASQAYSMSSSGEFTLSENKNAVVFIMDTLDGAIFDEIAEEDPAYLERFAGFTYFDNMCGAYPRTKGAVPFLMTGVWNENTMPYREYLQKAYAETDFFKDLNAANFDVRLFVSENYVSGQEGEYIHNTLQKSEKVIYPKLTELMLKFTAYRYMPHVLKEQFWFYSGDFAQIKVEEETDINIPERRYGADGSFSNDVFFYDTLMANGLHTQSETNSFQVYHLMASHAPYIINSDMEYLQEGEQGDVIEQTKGAINMIAEYFDQMKALGIYEDSLIIVVADHGYINLSQHPALLVKPVGSSEGFEVSSAPVHAEDFQATVLSQMGLDYEKYGRSVFEIPEDEERERRYLLFPWQDDSAMDYLLPLTEYVIRGDVADVANAYKTGKIYTQDGLIYEDSSIYTLGTTVPAAEISKYCEFGFDAPDTSGNVWSMGTESRLTLQLEDTPQRDLIFNLSLGTIRGKSQQVEIYANGEKIYDEDTMASICVEIPHELITDNQLVLDFQYPETVEINRQIGDEDTRKITLYVTSFTISECPENAFVSEYHFGADGNANAYKRNGWYVPGDQGNDTWASPKAEFVVYTEEQCDYELSLEYSLFEGSGITELYFNDTLVAELDGTVSNVRIPKELLAEGEIQRLTFLTPNAMAPSDLGYEDGRVLGIRMVSMTVTPVS